MVLKNSVLLSKTQNLVPFGLYDLVQILPQRGPNTNQIMYGETLNSTASICNSSTEKFQWQIYCKNWFSDRAFYITNTDAEIGSLKSLRTLFDKYLDHMQVKFEQNRKVRNIQNYELFCKKMVEKVLTPFWKTLLWHKQLFDAKVLIKRLSSFIVPKTMVVRHVKPG